ncbi:hypothetical protein DPMN_071874 [Dreissena polymorpha]|uniref:Uncharacterized protein n=1 Tax=Dreissena polymorpha TaxID=45954 RepID=A0A9D3Z7E3_DREPO|nr:hypothetical protein DPMN_071874 [Dreissena polymorpha]
MTAEADLDQESATMRETQIKLIINSRQLVLSDNRDCGQECWGAIKISKHQLGRFEILSIQLFQLS